MPMTDPGSPQWLTSEEAARRLGVKLGTLYSYVSRGLVHSTLAPDGRTSRFERADVEALLGRRRSKPGGTAETVLASAITSMGDEVLRFRGHAVADLARVFSYERVAALLWQADADGHAWPVRPLRLPSMPPATTLGDHIRVALVLTAAADPHRHDLRPESVVVSARQLIATAAAAMPPSADTAPALVIDDEKVQGSIASLVAARLGAAKVSARLVRAVNTALVVLADHELATSTFAARVAASTRADIGSALLAGASANGPLHMTAGRDVMLLLRDAEARGPAAAVGDLLRSGRRMPGFGHTIYRVDPRFPLLFDVIERAGLPARRVELVRELLAFAGERVAVAPNVDAAIAALCYAAGARLDATEAIFLVARMAGWTAHALEEYDEPPLRFRTRGLYVGERPG